MTRLGQLLLLVLLAAPIGGPKASACADAQACLHQVAEVQARIRSLSAHFVQTKHVSLLAEPIETVGTFEFKHPDMIVWRTEDPPFELRVEGGTVEAPDGNGAPPGALPALTGLFAGMSALFAGDLGKARHTFEIDARQTGDDIIVDMKPKNAAEYRLIASMRLTFARPDIVLQKIHIEEAVGDSLDIVFSETRRSLAER